MVKTGFILSSKEYKMNKIILKKKISVFITPAKYAWWLMKIAGKKLTGKIVTGDQNIETPGMEIKQQLKINN